MPLIVVGQGTPLIPAGTYPATLIGIAPKSLVTKFSKNGEEQDFLEWTWDVDGDEIRSLTSLATGPKSTMLTYLVALVGANAAQVGTGFDEGDLVGKQAMIQIVETPEGFSKIEGVMGMPKAASGTGKVKKHPSPAVAAPESKVVADVSTDDDDEDGEDDDDGDDLPF